MAGKEEPVLIIGAGVAGKIVAEVLNKNQCRDFKPVGFIDDDPEKQGEVLYGLPVLGTRIDIPEIVKRHQVKEIIIAIPSAQGNVIKVIIEICHQTKARLRILPGFYDLITSKIKVSKIRDVEVEDLLGRDPVALDIEQIAGYLANQKVLITGAGGSIGSELCRQAVRFFPEELILLGRGENSIYEIENELREQFPGIKLRAEIGDIKDRSRIERIFYACKPGVVFHAAAHKHVSFMEKCPDEAVKNNIIGTKNVSESAFLAGAGTFVLISTDKAVNPTSFMGATKRVAEMIIKSMNKKGGTRFVAVRFETSWEAVAV